MAIVISSILCLLFTLVIGGVGLLIKSQWLRLSALGGLIVSCALMIASTYTDFWAMDRCLDSGGKYNKSEQICEFG